MSVEPGKGGQDFLLSALDKIKYLNKLKNEFNFLIEVDGGVKDYNAQQLLKFRSWCFSSRIICF